MPDFQFTFTVRGIGAQRADTIRDRIEQRLVEDGQPPGAVSVARVTAMFRVLAVNVVTREVLDVTVEAIDEADAAGQVATADVVVARVGVAQG